MWTDSSKQSFHLYYNSDDDDDDDDDSDSLYISICLILGTAVSLLWVLSQLGLVTTLWYMYQDVVSS